MSKTFSRTEVFQSPLIQICCLKQRIDWIVFERVTLHHKLNWNRTDAQKLHQYHSEVFGDSPFHAETPGDKSFSPGREYLWKSVTTIAELATIL